jgi:hypothetical protein
MKYETREDERAECASRIGRAPSQAPRRNVDPPSEVNFPQQDPTPENGSIITRITSWFAFLVVSPHSRSAALPTVLFPSMSSLSVSYLASLAFTEVPPARRHMSTASGIGRASRNFRHVTKNLPLNSGAKYR